MGSSEEETHASPNASRGYYIVVHTGSIYIERTVARSELKSEAKKESQTLL